MSIRGNGRGILRVLCSVLVAAVVGGEKKKGGGLRVVSRTSGERILLITVGEAISGIASSTIQPTETVFFRGRGIVSFGYVGC